MSEQTCHLDFETFCEIDVRQVGAYRYATHSSIEVLIMAYELPGQPLEAWIPWERDRAAVREYLEILSVPLTKKQQVLKRAVRAVVGTDGVVEGAYPIPTKLQEYVEADEGTFTAHNAQFEACIWEYVMQRVHGAPRIAARRWRCTAAKAAAAGLPRSLAKVGIALQLQQQKDTSGTRLINLFCKPRKPTKANASTRLFPSDNSEEFVRFVNYCGDDVRTEKAVDAMVPDLPAYEWRVYRHTELMNKRGLPLDMVSVHKGFNILQALEKNVVKQVEQLTGGIRPTQRDKMLEFFNGLGLEMENTQAKTIKDLILLKGDELDPDARHLLMLRVEGGKASTKKLKKMIQVACDDGVVRGGFLYHGATTGRLTGKLVQPHNFTRGELTPEQLYAIFDLIQKEDPEVFTILYEWPIDILAQSMRGYIMARRGKKFVVVDFSAIEARVLVWLAREMRVVKLYHENADLYRLLAVRLYHLNGPDEVTVPQRKFAKDLFLGSGFQLGWVGFISNCLKRGIVVSEEEAKLGIKTYREDNPQVVKLWADVEECAIRAVETCATYTNPVQLRNLAFFVEDLWFCIKLPSGRLLRYPYPKVEMTMRFKKRVKKLTFRSEVKGHWVREGTYGGKLVENIVQAIARDLMQNACFNAEAKGYAVIGTVHDELITEVDEDFGSVHELEEILRMKPKWATDAPINAEGWEGKRYRK